jgi:6,7-dimethyl-8-ribityllumazine synthase
MAKKKTNLSAFDGVIDGDTSRMRIGVLVSLWNPEVTQALLNGVVATLKKHGVKESNVAIHTVPGSFELTAGASMMANGVFEPHAIICLGCIIQGETRHFEFIAQSVANGIAQVGIQYNLPVIFGVLTTDTHQQAMERAGGEHGNKGDEAAVAAMQMVSLHWKINAVSDELL